MLPLVNETGDPNNEYFSDGLSEELISALAQIKELKVIGRTSSFHFKNTNEESKVIGAALGVGYLLEGSVRKSAGRARIAVNLVRAADGANAWSQIYDRTLPDIFAVQAEIAQSVAGALKVALLGDADKNPDAPSNQNVDAYTAYLQGRYYEQRYTAADLRKAIGFYDAAIRSDPHYALAYAALSKSWWALGDITGEDVGRGQSQGASCRGARGGRRSELRGRAFCPRSNPRQRRSECQRVPRRNFDEPRSWLRLPRTRRSGSRRSSEISARSRKRSSSCSRRFGWSR